MKVSIITVCYNSEKTIEDTLKSVAEQVYENIEYLVIDGNSTDKTNDIIKKYSSIVDTHIIESDKGLYDAMNKGLKLATGELVGILNSDDVFYNKLTIENIVNALGSSDGVYADVGFYDDKLTTKTRHYSSKRFKKSKFSRGFMPAHPSFYLKKELIEKIGLYSLQYKIASDFDFLVRAFAIPNCHYVYLEQEVVKMREGGISTSGLSANILLNSEIINCCKKHGLHCSWLSILSKYPEKLLGKIFK